MIQRSRPPGSEV